MDSFAYAMVGFPLVSCRMSISGVIEKLDVLFYKIIKLIFKPASRPTASLVTK